MGTGTAEFFRWPSTRFASQGLATGMMLCSVYCGGMAWCTKMLSRAQYPTHQWHPATFHWLILYILE